MDHFLGSLTGLIFKTIEKAHGYSAKRWENARQKTKETHNVKEARGGRSVAWGKSYPKKLQTSFSKKKKKQETYVRAFAAVELKSYNAILAPPI